MQSSVRLRGQILYMPAPTISAASYVAVPVRVTVPVPVILQRIVSVAIGRVVEKSAAPVDSSRLMLFIDAYTFTVTLLYEPSFQANDQNAAVYRCHHAVYDIVVSFDTKRFQRVLGGQNLGEVLYWIPVNVPTPRRLGNQFPRTCDLSYPTMLSFFEHPAHIASTKLSVNTFVLFIKYLFMVNHFPFSKNNLEQSLHVSLCCLRSNSHQVAVTHIVHSAL